MTNERGVKLAKLAGWLIFFAGLGCLLLMVPEEVLRPESHNFILLIGAVGIWRYSIGITHFVRGMWFLKVVFPRLRRAADEAGEDALPSQIYLMVTSFRIDAHTTAKVYNAVFEEAKRSGIPCTVVASIVEMGDERLIRALYDQHQCRDAVSLRIVRIPGTGKRDGLAHGFRAISRDMPASDAVVAVIDGDTVLAPGCVLKTVPFFKLRPKMGALTTNEFCEVQGSYSVCDSFLGLKNYASH